MRRFLSPIIYFLSIFTISAGFSQSAFGADRFADIFDSKTTKTTPLYSRFLELDQPTFEAVPEPMGVGKNDTIYQQLINSKVTGLPLNITGTYSKQEPLGAVPFVIGGDDVPAGARGFQVSLQDPVYGQHYCGGSLIADEWVLTAAHCVESYIVSNGINAVVGTNDLSMSLMFAIPAVDIVVHPLYDRSNSEFDVAVIRLAYPAPDYIPRLNLADETIMAEYAKVGDIATLSGWGATDNEGTEPPLMLQQVDVPVVDTSICSDAYTALGLPTVTENMICAGVPEGGKDSCFGDSGGPLTVNVDGEDYSIGIVSWGFYECGLPGTPGVYTRTASVAEWVAEAMQAELIPTIPFNPDEPIWISGVLGEYLAYSFSLPSSVRNLNVNLTGGFGDADIILFSSPFLLERSITCFSGGAGNEENCNMPVAPGGTYTVLVAPFTDFGEAQLTVSYDPAVIENGEVIEGIHLRQFTTTEIFFTIPEDATNLSVSLTGGFGDADILVLQTTPGATDPWSCYSGDIGNEESCTLEDAPAGDYMIILLPYTDIEDVSLSLNYTIEQPFFPQAICQHNVVMQLGKYSIASINVVNISDEYLSGWFVEWAYETVGAEVKFLYNGLLSGTNPYRAQSLEPSSAISPGGVSTIFAFVKTPNGALDNPPVTGNYCF